MAKGIYVDTYGRSHVVSKKLSSGGQGIVYSTEEPNVLLKLEWNVNTEKIELDTSKNIKFDNIRVLPLIENTNITLPQTILKDAVGYTMKMLDGMISFDDAFNGENYELPNNEWLNSIQQVDKYWGDTFQKYIATGGIRKRLNAFLKVSCILSKIHASGLVYSDISGKNMFVSFDPQMSNVWLIDCDNLDFMKNSIRKKDGGLHSPGYGAPEIYASKGKTMYSDAFSFAIALFWGLTMNHPFKGKAASEWLDNLDMLDAPEEDYICDGSFAWIYDLEDDSNSVSDDIPIEMFVTSSLMDKFQKTFSRVGIKNKQKRTTMPEWSYILAKEVDHIIKCNKCEMDYYGTENNKCPWCDAENSVIKVSSYKLVGEQKILRWSFVKELSDGVINIPLRVLEGFCSDHLDENACNIIWESDGIEVDGVSNQFEFFWLDNKEKPIYGNTKFSRRDNVSLLIKDKRNSNNYLLEIKVTQ